MISHHARWELTACFASILCQVGCELNAGFRFLCCSVEHGHNTFRCLALGGWSSPFASPGTVLLSRCRWTILCFVLPLQFSQLCTASGDLTSNPLKSWAGDNWFKPSDFGCQSAVTLEDTFDSRVSSKPINSVLSIISKVSIVFWPEVLLFPFFFF